MPARVTSAPSTPWIAIVAADLSRRIRWRRTGSPRGADRLLWMCEQMATPLHAANDTPTPYSAAIRRGITGPDWTTSARPSGCRLDPADYVTLLRDRTTNSTIEPQPLGAKVTAPGGASVVTWADNQLEAFLRYPRWARLRACQVTYREAHPVATRPARLLGRHTEERAWQAGADGEIETARHLRELTDPSPWQLSHCGTWRILHSVPIGDRGSDIDHVLIGAPGVFTINTKHYRDKLITITTDAVIIDKRRTRHAEIARAEADRAAELLAAAVGGRRVPVFPVISVVGAGALVATTNPAASPSSRSRNSSPHGDGARVAGEFQTRHWLLQLPHRYQPHAIDGLYAVARRSTTWQP